MVKITRPLKAIRLRAPLHFFEGVKFEAISPKEYNQRIETRNGVEGGDQKRA